MRSDTANFSAKNTLLAKEPRYYVEIMYDTAYTDPYYFTSHADVDLPSTATSANTFHGTLKRPTGTSQKLNIMKAVSTIGGGTVEIVDVNGVLSNLLSTKWAADEALRYKRFRTYVGYKGLANADYALISTQIKQNHTFNGTSYTFHLEDLQRNVKNDIFILEDTTLSQSVTIDQVAVPVQATSAFSTNWHDANHTDLPSTDVGYISIKPSDNKEVISWTGKVSTAIGDTGTDISFANADSSINATSTDLSIFTAGQFLNVAGSTSNDGNYIINTVSSTKLTLYALDGTTAATITTEAAGDTVTVTAPVQFYGCTRGALNTRAQPYEVDTTISADRREKVTEHVYIETAVPKIIYALLTGIWYGTANTCPWNLGIDTSLVNSASFIDKLDLYDPSDESGRIFRFSGEKKIDGKKFIQEQLCRPLALYLRVLNDGDLALRRATGILSDASYVQHLTESDITEVGTLMYDDKEVYNQFDISWNWDDFKDTTTRVNFLEDTTSQTKHGKGKERLSLEFRGLHGSAATIQDIYSNFNMLRDRYAGPPLKWSIQVLHKHNNLEIGDIVRVTLADVKEATNKNVTYVDRSFEVQGKTVDWVTGRVRLDLFGSTDKAGELSQADASTVLSDSFYTTGGTALSSVLTISADHVTANGSLTGNEDGSLAIYYHTTDLTIDPGVTVTTDKNVRIYVKGHLTLNGTIDSSGGGDSNGDGALGITKSTGGMTVLTNAFSTDVFALADGSINEATYPNMPFFDLQPDSAGNTIAGLPADLQGMVGPTGGDNDLNGTPGQSGTTGGNGGGGLVIVCRGISPGASGKIITSGNDSTAAGTDTYTIPYKGTVTLHAGSGGGGAPGGVLILIDGNAYTSALSDTNFEQYLGDCPKLGNAFYSTSQYYLQDLYNGNYQGYTTLNQNSSFWRVQYVPDTTAAVSDAPDTATTATTVTPTETPNSPQTTGQNLSTIQVDITAPSDSNYAYSNVYYKLDSQTDYTLVGPARNSVTLPPTVMDGSTYDIIAKPVSVKGIESESYTHTTKTVSTAAGYVTMGSGNHVKAGQTAYDTGTGFYLGNDSGTPKFSIGNSAGNKVTWDGSTLAVTGTITATTGTIGGWTLGATSLTSGSGGTTVGLDSGGSNPAIYAGSATPGSAPFRVTNAGVLTATSGTVGGWTMSSTTLTSTNIGLDSSNQKIYIGGSTWQSAGFYADYSGGSGRFYAGDGSNNFAQFDGTNFTVGVDAIFHNTSTYQGTANFIAGGMGIVGQGELTTGSSYVTRYGECILYASTSGYARCYHGLTIDTAKATWALDRKFKTSILVGATNNVVMVGLGQCNYHAATPAAQFVFDSDGNIYAQCGNGTNYEVSSSLGSYAVDTKYDLEIIFTSGTDAKFYINGSLSATLSTYIPSGTTGADYSFCAQHNRTTSDIYAKFGYTTYWQEPS